LAFTTYDITMFDRLLLKTFSRNKVLDILNQMFMYPTHKDTKYLNISEMYTRTDLLLIMLFFAFKFYSAHV
jgi:hypothetical protein